MNAFEMQNEIKKIVDNEFGLQVFAVINNRGTFSISKFLFDDGLKEQIKDVLNKNLRENFLQDDVEVDSAENIADNRKIFYEISQNDDYHPFAFLSAYNSVTEVYSERSINQIMGFAFRINIDDAGIWLYQQIVYPQLIKRSKHLYAILSGDNIYTLLNKDVLKIENKIDCLIIGSSIITSNIKLMQRCFQFESFIRKEAAKTIQLIVGMDILDDPKMLDSLGKVLTNAKKLMRAISSPVLKMDKNILLRKLETLSYYNLEIENGKIKINNQKQAVEFLKMLNDSILKSELTDVEYDSTVKKELSSSPK